MNNQRPLLSKAKTVQLMVLLTLLAWATQTLLHQWGYGQDVASPAVIPLGLTAETTGGERFVPNDRATLVGGALEVRGEAVILGANVELKQVCRWSRQDAP